MLTIPKNKNTEVALDQTQLYQLGLAHAQRLAKQIWTDYNVHDPGITILELLSYALTDLSYRASLPIKDLLASKENNAEKMKAQFFSARTILPNRPLTLPDYRKLLIDLKGVKNAWLHVADLTYYADTIKAKLLADDPKLPGIEPVQIAGLYDVRIDFMDDVRTQAHRKRVMKSVEETLNANRNLCEDFVDFSTIEEELFLLCGEFELSPDADVAKVKAEILFQVQHYLAPGVTNYTLTEMLAKKNKDGDVYTTDEIFNGPSLQHGFIDSNELAEADLRTEIRLSDLINIIMDIEGVRAVRDMVINPQAASEPLKNKWLVPVSPLKKAMLEQALSRLVFYKRKMPVVANSALVSDYLVEMAEAASVKNETAFPYDFDIPVGRWREPTNYTSFQNDFPDIYQRREIAFKNTTDTAEKSRQAQAYQLKAYLLFFDQLMANYLAQLGEIKTLFSDDPNVERTYFYQAVDSFSEYQKIYQDADVVTSIKNNVEDSGVLIDRRMRFLDHLIARFAEQFNDFVNIMHSAFGSTQKEMISYKALFLQDYPAISSERSLAYNYSLKTDEALWNSDNVSGLERRLARLLGIRDMRRRNLGDIAYDIYAEIDTTPDDEFRFRMRHRVSGAILLSSSTNYVTKQDAKDEMQRAIKFALLPAGYERKLTESGKYYFNVIDDTGEVLARRIHYFDSADIMNAEIEFLITYLQENYNDEGMYVIENILLRPERKNDPFLPICVDPNCGDCSEKDPYSYRLHIILPAESSRFSHMDFRRFSEGIIREEVPAHILPKICWVGKYDMAILEKAYQDWIYLKSGRTKAQRLEKLMKLINILFSGKNIYPTERLRTCESEGEQAKFILGRTVLGSHEDKENIGSKT